MKSRHKVPVSPAKRSRPQQPVDRLMQEAVNHHWAGRLVEAESLYRQVLQVMPAHPDALHLLGVVSSQAGKYATALELIDKALVLKPNCAEILKDRGIALHGLQRYQAAVESYDKAIQLQPTFAEACNHRGNALYLLHQNEAAVESFDKAIQYQPDFAEAYSNRAAALHGLQQYQAAVESCDKAILFKPNYPHAYNNRGKALQALLQYQAALESFNKASFLRPDFEYLDGMRLQTKQAVCDWGEFDAQLQHLEADIDKNKVVVTPFVFLTLSDSPALQKKASEIYMRDKYLPSSPVALIPHRPGHDKIRIGYFSADYHNHATCYLMAELFERHDRSKFEILGFSFGPDIQDEMRERASAAMDRFMDVRSLSDAGVAQLSRQLEVDIAVDLKGFTKDSRPGIFVERAAPLQVNYLGYPGTTGSPSIDYLIADHTVIPEASQRYYSEKIVYLPDSYQANDSKRLISASPRTRIEEGLPERGFVYCCFNNNYKITSEVFDIWMRILAQVEGSVLWLLEDNPGAADNLRKEAVHRGVSQKRLIFAKRMPLAEHLARHSLADLFLDTFPCNAHTTASDALWAGLLVLTRMGESFASRVAASLLRAIELPQLVTTTKEAYEALAVEFGRNTELHHAIREKLQRSRHTAPLFNISGFTQRLESAYSAMYERYQAGLPPDHIDVTRFPASTGFLAHSVVEGKSQEALKLLEAAIAEGETAELWNDWATVLHACGDLARAEAGYRCALKLNNLDRQAAVNLGFLLFAQGRLQEAMPFLERHKATLTAQEKQAIAEMAAHYQAHQAQIVFADANAPEAQTAKR